MKSLRGRFIKTTILMAIISTALVVFVTLLLLFVFSVCEPYGFERIWIGINSMKAESHGDGHYFMGYIVLWAILAVGMVLLTCTFLSAKLSRDMLKAIKELRQAAENIKEGNLNFEVMACKDQELNDLCNSFDEIRKQLKANAEKELRSKEERNMLMANLSHDMRTPITTIKGYLEGIKDGVANSPEKLDKYLDTIYSKAIVLQKLVDNMAEYSELELGKMQYAFEFVNITELLNSLGEDYKTEVQEQGLEMKVSILSEELTVVGDKSKLKRVFDNLVSNAIKYNKEEGTISISMEKERNGALICISDTGKGIKEKDINKVFDGFYRGDAARSNIKGNGLGLGISKQIIESHHGKIWIKSEENVGTEVFIYLPLRSY
ncbi:sensor histidine kinase [Aminipila terrae]|uniref:histidine kinase n=1 Tax=Aminipila terrae TaxID=2697030 RepID=A0A6P1MCQ2_9FIRM|nr:HAMP domain-containing sensor histidine kinase [Aminipila terrae]QHI71802.1 two-component sensor histidine kinase [Aminipila terrae]